MAAIKKIYTKKRFFQFALIPD